ncbi:hypothetical protein [Sulfoacidibacillus thermotolerans]|nr:hypothetical protein [Sulfoacidibacillus thermotolerans]
MSTDVVDKPNTMLDLAVKIGYIMKVDVNQHVGMAELADAHV